MKNKTTALILAILVGGFGVDRFYLGYTGLGILKLLTGGCFGILWLIDIIRIATGSLRPADGSAYEEEVRNNQNTYSNAAPQVQQTSNPYEDLERVSKLHDNGILTDEEYTNLKSQIMSKL